MMFSEAPKEKQEHIKECYKNYFGIDIEKYTDEELKIVIEEIGKVLKRKIKEENAKKQELKKQLEVDMMNLESI